jgi:hypoxia up-regulated 1
MKFAYIKHLAELVANEKVTDVVVATSPYYSQLERDSIADAIEISSLHTPDMVQTAVKGPVGEYAPFEISFLLFLTMLLSDKITLNVNVEEAAVLGAALYGTSLSRQFETKPIRVSDISVYGIQVSYFSAAVTANSRPRRITTLIFTVGSNVGAKKALTFKRKEEISLFLDYKTPVSPYVPNLHFCTMRIDGMVIRGFPTRMEIEIAGVAGAVTNLTERGAVDPVITACLFSRTLASSPLSMPSLRQNSRTKVWI